MKQFLLLFTLLLIIHSANSQVLYQQDFTNGKEDMITIDNDKKAPAANVAAYAESWFVTDARSPGNPAAINNSWYEPVGKADDWLITPLLSGVDAKTVITWNAQAIDADFPNGYRVMVSPTGGDKISDFKDVIFSINGENPQLTSRSVFLDKYAGKDIRIAFNDNSNDQFLLLLDDIVVQKLQDRDAKINAVASTSYALNGSNADVFYQFANSGFNKITSIELEFNDGTSSKIEKIESLNLAYGETYEGVYSYKVTTNSTKNITVKVVSVNNGTDLDASNNTGSTSISGVSKLINKKLVAEEGTGTWCPWCPRGAVFMEKMKKDHPDDFIGIAVHNGSTDPMVVTAYDSALGQLDGFPGYPSVVVNRQSIIDPDQLPDYLAEVTSRESAPVELNVRQSKVGRKITIEGDVEFFTNVTDADFGIVVVVVEDGVKGTTTGYRQANNYADGAAGPMGGYESLPNPVPAAQMVYNEVARAIPFGFNGKNDVIPAKVNEGDVFLFSVDYTAPSAQKIDNLHSVLFVVNNKTGEIINGAKTESFAVNVKDIDELDHVSIYPNPTSDASFINLNLNTLSEVSVNIQNNLGQSVASKEYGKLSGIQVLPVVTNNFASGLYHVQIVVNGKVTSQKLIVE
ncbi:MAG: choice-of-anchor J domain-containing protein [Saprospiraceae bacterium]|nr:choice-of-anchor J domain-containing protein [Saprospiraceae bacterium]